MVRGVAKGSRRPKSPYSGGVEPLTIGQAGIIVRRNSELALITEWDLIDPWRHIRQDWQGFLAANYLADLVQHFVRDHDPHRAMFDVLVGVWTNLVPSKSVWPELLTGIWTVLSEAGYRPSLTLDAASGEALNDAASYLFVPELGGLTASNRADGWRVRHETVEALRGLDSVEPESVRSLSRKLVASAIVAERGCRLLSQYARYLLGVEPPSHIALFGSGASSNSAGG